MFCGIRICVLVFEYVLWCSNMVYRKLHCILETQQVSVPFYLQILLAWCKLALSNVRKSKSNFLEIVMPLQCLIHRLLLQLSTDVKLKYLWDWQRLWLCLCLWTRKQPHRLNLWSLTWKAVTFNDQYTLQLFPLGLDQSFSTNVSSWHLPIHLLLRMAVKSQQNLPFLG